MENLAILALALVFDLAFGEPPRAAHLTVWAGRAIDFFARFGLAIRSPFWQFIYGMVLTVSLVSLFGAASYFLLDYLSGLNSIVYIIVAMFILKTTFCLKESWSLSSLVADYLRSKVDNPSKAPKPIRFLLATVERNEDDAVESPVASSTIRSLFENASDFLVAPVFYFLIFGVPGALAYRVANVLDGMIGHRGEYEYLGKFAAYLDRVINFIPARLTALLTVLAAALSRDNAYKAWKVAVRDHSKTESTNAGWPMAAAAGALEVELKRAGHYSLGQPDKPLTAATIKQAVGLFQLTALLLAVASLMILVAVA
jgi:adenosylcobinamide-phosphate synthase